MSIELYTTYRPDYDHPFISSLFVRLAALQNF
ncbi:hypothetical protein J2X84_002615 [Pseudomonas corrugata]|nr:hypothetical protein [Pseudomonas corrugata]